MVELPDATALGRDPSLHGDRAVANLDTTALGEGVAAFGDSLARTGALLQQRWQDQDDANAYSGYLAFKANETAGYNAALKGLDPGEARGFVERYTAAYGERARAFLDRLPDRLKQPYGDRLGLDALSIIQGTQAAEHEQQTRQATATLDAAIAGAILPRARLAAGLPDDRNKEPQLAELERDANALVEANPVLSAAEKAAAKAELQANIHRVFAAALPPAEKLRVNPAPAPVTVDPAGGGQASAGRAMERARPGKTNWAARLSGLSYLDKVAIAQDGGVAALQEHAAAADAARTAHDAWYNAALNAIDAGSFGLADLQAARASGMLGDPRERDVIAGKIMARDVGHIRLKAATGRLDSGSSAFDPFSDADRRAIDLIWTSSPGANDQLLDAPDADAGGTGTASAAIAPQNALLSLVRRSGIIPAAAVATIRAGIHAADSATRDRAFMTMDALSRADPATYFRAFTSDDRKRADIYQALMPTAGPEVVAAELGRLTPQLARDHAALAEIGRAHAGNADIQEIIAEAFAPAAAGDGVSGGGPGRLVPDGASGDLLLTALRDDHDNAFASAFATMGNAAAAKQLAHRWLRYKYGPTGTGGRDPGAGVQQAQLFEVAPLDAAPWPDLLGRGGADTLFSRFPNS